MITKVEPMDRGAWLAMRALVAKLIPHLDWRHSGLGMLQAYVRESDAATATLPDDATDDEVRVHIWHPNLRRAGIERSGLLHDHRFDMLSQVLHGGIGQVEYTLTPVEPGAEGDGDHVQHEVLHARAALSTVGSFHAEPRLLEGRYKVATEQVTIPAGAQYRFPARQFHGTHPTSTLTVTVVTKSRQTDEPARILAPHDVPIVHAFSDPLPRAAWRDVLDRAAGALLGPV